MLTHEERLVRYCCCLRADKDSEEKIIRILSPGLNWAYFLERAKQEKVASLLYQAFEGNKAISALIPENVLAELKAVYYTVVGKNILAGQTLKNIAGKFKDAGIPFFVLKGLSLAESVYKDLGLRPLGDMDILVKIKDVADADRMLDSIGYKKPFMFNYFSRLSYSAYRNSFLYHNPDAYPGHLHLFWHIINLYPYNKNIPGIIDMDKIWDDAVEIPSGNISIRTFSTYHQIIYLCLHALTHLYKPFILLCDINELIHSEKERIDWDILANESINFGLSKYVYYGLYFTREILGAAVPEEPLRRLKPRKISFFEQMFIRRILNGGMMIDERSALFLLYLGMNETLLRRLKFARDLCFPPARDLGVIQQKEASRIPALDYIRRILAGG